MFLLLPSACAVLLAVASSARSEFGPLPESLPLPEQAPWPARAIPAALIDQLQRAMPTAKSMTPAISFVNVSESGLIYEPVSPANTSTAAYFPANFGQQARVDLRSAFPDTMATIDKSVVRGIWSLSQGSPSWVRLWSEDLPAPSGRMLPILVANVPRVETLALADARQLRTRGALVNVTHTPPAGTGSPTLLQVTFVVGIENGTVANTVPVWADPAHARDVNVPLASIRRPNSRTAVSWTLPSAAVLRDGEADPFVTVAASPLTLALSHGASALPQSMQFDALAGKLLISPPQSNATWSELEWLRTSSRVIAGAIPAQAALPAIPRPPVDLWIAAVDALGASSTWRVLHVLGADGRAAPRSRAPVALANVTAEMASVAVDALFEGAPWTDGGALAVIGQPSDAVEWLGALGEVRCPLAVAEQVVHVVAVDKFGAASSVAVIVPAAQTIVPAVEVPASPPPTAATGDAPIETRAADDRTDFFTPLDTTSAQAFFESAGNSPAVRVIGGAALGVVFATIVVAIFVAGRRRSAEKMGQLESGLVAKQQFKLGNAGVQATSQKKRTDSPDFPEFESIDLSAPPSEFQTEFEASAQNTRTAAALNNPPVESPPAEPDRTWDALQNPELFCLSGGNVSPSVSTCTPSLYSARSRAVSASIPATTSSGSDLPRQVSDELPVVHATAAVGQPFALTVPGLPALAGEGERFVAIGAPSWLMLDPKMGSFSGIPLAGDASAGAPRADVTVCVTMASITHANAWSNRPETMAIATDVPRTLPVARVLISVIPAPAVPASARTTVGPLTDSAGDDQARSEMSEYGYATAPPPVPAIPAHLRTTGQLAGQPMSQATSNLSRNGSARKNLNVDRRRVTLAQRLSVAGHRRSLSACGVGGLDALLRELARESRIPDGHLRTGGASNATSVAGTPWPPATRPGTGIWAPNWAPPLPQLPHQQHGAEAELESDAADYGSPYASEAVSTSMPWHHGLLRALDLAHSTDGARARPRDTMASFACDTPVDEPERYL